MTFTLGHHFIKVEVPNDGHVTNIQVLSTSKMPLNMIDKFVKNNTSKASRNIRAMKIAKTERSQTGGPNINGPNTVGFSPRLLSIKITIVSITITLGTIKPVMLTSIEENKVSPLKPHRLRSSRNL